MGYKTRSKKIRVQKKTPAPKISQKEMRSQLVGWSIYRITHSPDSVRGDIQKLFENDSQKKQRERFPGFLETTHTESMDEGYGKRKIIKNLREFLEDPAGKEFTIFMRNQADANALNKFIEQCGLLRNVITDYYPKSSDADNPEFPDKFVVTAKKKAVKKLGKTIGAAYILSKNRPSTPKKIRISDNPEETIDLGDGAAKPKEEGIEDLSKRGLFANKKRVKKASKEVPIIAMKVKVPNAAKTRNVSLFPSSEKRDEFMAHYKAGAEYSFEIKGSSSFKTYFKNEMRKQGLDPEQVRILKGSGKRWRVMLLEDAGRAAREEYLNISKSVQG